MTRWFLRGAVAAAGWGWVGLAAAQLPSPAALANTGTVPSPAIRATSDEVAVLLMRTTGQPDRRLKVLNRSTYSDGESLVDVQDLASGQKFTLPGKLADRLPRESAAAPPVAFPPPAAQSLTTPTPPKFHQPEPVAPVAPVAPASPNVVERPSPVPAPPSAPLQLPGGQTGTVWRPLAAPVPPTPVPAAALPPPQPNLVPIGSASLPMSAAPTTPVPIVAPPTAPTGDRWKPIPAPPPLSPPLSPPGPAPHPTPAPPGDDDGMTARGQMPDRPVKAPPSGERKVGVARLPADASPPVRSRTTTAEARPTWTPTTGDDWLAEIVRREMQPMADQLVTALRPSVRVNAALGLADMRYAARPEVKAVLARAAMTDPAAMVRTVCVRALAALGHNEPAYVEYLRQTARADGDAPEQLRMAAAFALHAVTPRD